MYELALFAGAGGSILGGELLGWTCVGACEIEEYPRAVLLRRQADGILPPFPVWDDIRTFRADNPDCAEYFDFLRDIAGDLVITGGFPCQDISGAGKGAGIEGERSGLWKEMSRIIREVRPRCAFVENSPHLVRRGLAVALGDLAEIGYDARWTILGADDVGAPHRRKRIWIRAELADPESEHDGECNTGAAKRQKQEPGKSRRPRNVPNPDRINDNDRRHGASAICREQRQQPPELPGSQKNAPDTDKTGRKKQQKPIANAEEHQTTERGGWWTTKPDVGRVAHGVAHGLDRNAAHGEGQVPLVAAVAWTLLAQETPTT